MMKYSFSKNSGKDRFYLTKDRWLKDDPIDILTAQVVEQRTDFTLGQTLPLRFTRTWARSKEQ